MTQDVSVEVIEPRLFDGAVADELVACINEVVQERRRCTIVLAGGSTPGGVYRSLIKPPRVAEVPWEKLTLFMGDERWVPAGDDQSNARMIEETLLSQLPGAKPRFFPVDTSLESPSRSATAYEGVIRKELSLAPEETPRFDIVILGMGEDGHTASLFPGEPTLEQVGVAAAAINPHNQTERVTLLAPALFNAQRVFFIVKGEAKADTIRRVIEGNESPAVLPSRLYTTARGDLTFFLDSAAAKSLSKRGATV